MVGVCSDVKIKKAAFYFCAREIIDEIYYIIRVDITSTKPINEKAYNAAVLKNTISGRAMPLKFDSQIATEKGANVFFHTYAVEVPPIFIKHIRNGVPTNIVVTIDGARFNFVTSSKARTEIRMVSQFDFILLRKGLRK